MLISLHKYVWHRQIEILTQYTLEMFLLNHFHKAINADLAEWTRKMKGSNQISPEKLANVQE